MVVQVKGLESETYAITLLSEEEGSGPWNKQEAYEDTYDDENDNEAVWTALNSYEDPDGFYFLGYYRLHRNLTASNTLGWYYYPPDTFKLLIYLPETDTYITNDVIYRRFVSPREPRKTAPMVYSFAANTASFVLGVVLAKYLPSLF